MAFIALDAGIQHNSFGS